MKALPSTVDTQPVFDAGQLLDSASTTVPGKRPPDNLLPIRALVDLFALPGQGTTAGYARIHLPTFQRGEVWKSQQVCELWDSLLRGIPLPSILLGKVGASAGQNQVLVKTGLQPDPDDYWLLDGQQRAMALQIGMGLRPREHRLWLDLGWDVDRAKQYGRRFGFFLCSQARPWGDNFALNGRPDNKAVREARRHIDSFQALNGCFDFQISLSRTWPVHAKKPVPAALLLRWALRQPTPEAITLTGIKKIVERSVRCLQIPPDKRWRSVTDDTYLPLQKALQRLRRTTITIVRADELDPEEGSNGLMATFSRLNRNGSQLKDDELFYSALKHDMPQCHGLVQEATKQSPLLGELDILRGYAVLASQQSKVDPKDGSSHVVTGTALSPVLLKTLRGNEELKPGFDAAINGYLKQPSWVMQTIESLRFRPGGTPADPGLPLVLFPRLDIHSWLPVLRWLEKRSGGGVVLPAEREALLRYVLIDHLFADWHGGHDALLREFLDQVTTAAKGGQLMPLPNPAGWLKELRVPQASSGEQVVPLPLSPADVQTRFQRHSDWPAGDDGQLWLTGRFRDLLMWAQRGAIEEWFGGLDKEIQHLGEVGRPWDWDHITPSDFFNYHGAQNPSDPHGALGMVWRTVPPSPAPRAWEMFKSYRNRTGNYRLWPMGFNRKDGDASPKDKLQLPVGGQVDPHIVLAPWMQGQAGHPQALRQASAIQPAEPWDQTPDHKAAWTRPQMDAFLQAVTEREQAIYGDLWRFIVPGLPLSWQANRL